MHPEVAVGSRRSHALAAEAAALEADDAAARTGLHAAPAATCSDGGGRKAAAAASRLARELAAAAEEARAARAAADRYEDRRMTLADVRAAVKALRRQPAGRG